MLESLISLIAQYGLWLVFAGVLIEQLGLPVPAVPTMIVAGALAADGKLSVAALFAAAFVASLIADLLWYWAGWRFGSRVLKFLCRISFSPDTCVRQSEARFDRWGGGILAIAKFVPGLAVVAPPLAGAMRLRLWQFLLFNGTGIVLWAGAAIGAGWLFHAQIDRVFARMEDLGTFAVVLIAAAFVAYAALKYWQRRRLYKMLRMARIGVDELYELMEAGRKPVVVDVRSSVARALDGRIIPGALEVDIDQVDVLTGQLHTDSEIILYCTCPNEATAARVARQLMDRGYHRVRPLEGGLDAWVEKGYPIGVPVAAVVVTAPI